MITYQVESFAKLLPELKPLLPLHYAELALNQDKVPLSPQFGVYLAREMLGEVTVVTVRKFGALIGYFIGFVAPGLHYSTCLTCTMDIFYVHPDHRGGVGVKLFKALEAELKRRGVKRLFVGTKLHKDVSRLFDHLGYTEVERYYSAWLGE